MLLSTITDLLSRNWCILSQIEKKVDRFLVERSFMWPTFAANGFGLADR